MGQAVRAERTLLVGAFSWLLRILCVSAAKRESALYFDPLQRFVEDHIARRVFLHVREDNLTCSFDEAPTLRPDTDARTHTHTLIEIDSCAAPAYRLKELLPAQVSWKKVGNASQPKKAQEHDSEGQYADNTAGHIIPEHLVFALTLKHSPFSIEVLSMLTSVALMFPSIQFVYGDGVDFHRFCSQYAVRSLPAVLLFRKGILMKRYRGPKRPGDFAAFVARWSALPVRAVPVPFEYTAAAQNAHYMRTWGGGAALPSSFSVRWGRASVNGCAALLAPWFNGFPSSWLAPTYPIGEEGADATAAFGVLLRLALSDFWMFVSLVYVLIRLLILFLGSRALLWAKSTAAMRSAWQWLRPASGTTTTTAPSNRSSAVVITAPSTTTIDTATSAVKYTVAGEPEASSAQLREHSKSSGVWG
jgi:hypothetical protein